MMYPLRIDFRDEETAYRLFHKFPPDDLPYLEGCSQKRHGASQFLLLKVSSEDDLGRFIMLCRGHPAVVGVATITEAEFWAAPSNAIQMVRYRAAA